MNSSDLKEAIIQEMCKWVSVNQDLTKVDGTLLAPGVIIDLRRDRLTPSQMADYVIRKYTPGLIGRVRDGYVYSAIFSDTEDTLTVEVLWGVLKQQEESGEGVKESTKESTQGDGGVQEDTEVGGGEGEGESKSSSDYSDDT